MDQANLLRTSAREALRQGLQAAFPRIHLEFDATSEKWFPQNGLRGSRFLGHSGINDHQAQWLLANTARVSELDVLLERYTDLMAESA
ncbi:hypothetical protein [uncultured Paludibaculum sp.]|uniref:hypothetical protein n=1 Tax=uncultured Paludibaculum sp. TaxID=1765020 RepID=UPI002AAAD426|nr:hypothetical protein [uncultured Paludibaculum sp.]